MKNWFDRQEIGLQVIIFIASVMAVLAIVNLIF